MSCTGQTSDNATHNNDLIWIGQVLALIPTHPAYRANGKI